MKLFKCFLSVAVIFREKKVVIYAKEIKYVCCLTRTRLLSRIAEQLGVWYLLQKLLKFISVTFALHSGSGQTGSILRPRLRLS
jgi:hypothetical protein